MLRNGKKEFIYVLKPVERLLREGFTELDNKIIKEHFEYLQNLLIEEKLVIAGKTDGFNSNTFGIVILKTFSEEEAKELMINDPVVKEKIMEGSLYPYKIALSCF